MLNLKCEIKEDDFMGIYISNIHLYKGNKKLENKNEKLLSEYIRKKLLKKGIIATYEVKNH